MSDVDIVDYDPQHQRDFERLNLEWLERFFTVEAIDRRVLGSPDEHVLRGGGAILFARRAGAMIGTVALIHQGGGVYELTKMAVTASAQGQGVGARLLSAVIERFERVGGRRLYLESHSSLHAALALYRRAGFDDAARPTPSEYQRSDVYMVYQPRKPG